MIKNRGFVSKLNDDELFKLAKRLILREEFGYYINEQLFKAVFKEANKRNKTIFEFAFKDAIFLANQVRSNMGEVKIIDLKRIDFLSQEQLKVLLFTIGAAKNHENIAEKETEVTTITNIFGMELEDLLLCKVVGDSMENAHIFEGDTLIIDTKTNPKDSDIIVININNQTVVKKLKLTGSEMMLIPENEKFDPHLISENDNYTIIGKVKHILHSL